MYSEYHSMLNSMYPLSSGFQTERTLNSLVIRNKVGGYDSSEKNLICKFLFLT
jgi:hypothetical protein